LRGSGLRPFPLELLVPRVRLPTPEDRLRLFEQANHPLSLAWRELTSRDAGDLRQLRIDRIVRGPLFGHRKRDPVTRHRRGADPLG